jgi:uracil-DNA glycosylase family 4
VPTALEDLRAEIVACRACPRLVAWREEVACTKRAAYRDEDYWGRPVPGFGDPQAVIVLLGLAPAAHGANRTGRMFTGDRSGAWLYGALHRAGLANQGDAERADDGLRLRGAYVTAAVRCAPPANRPSPEERDRCLPFLPRELEALGRARVVVVLGAFAYDALCRALGDAMPRPRPRFAHGLEVTAGRWSILGCYHPSQQNTFTGRLTAPMLDAVIARAMELAGLERARAARPARSRRTRPR